MRCARTLLFGSLLPVAAAAAAPVEQRVPFHQHTQTLVAAEDQEVRKYLAFPITLVLGEDDVLVAYKRGFAHAFDAESSFDLARYHPRTERLRPQGALGRPANNFENAEFVRFANGDIACYIDNQRPGRVPGDAEATRLGLLEFRSTDGGRTFRDLGPVGRIDGVEYGYVFEALTEGGTTWMLAMTFANLPGGQPIRPGRRAGSVAVLATTDHGRTWRTVVNLTERVGEPINESTFLRHGDGFLLSCRSYETAHWLVATDGAFNVRRKVNLVAEHDFIGAAIGRPRLFTRDGGHYLLGRNRLKPAAPPVVSPAYHGTAAPEPRQMLSLFRFDPATLALEKHVVLDNAENQRVADAYYATPFWHRREGRTFLNVITYKMLTGRRPDIVRLEYDWAEVR